MARGHHRAVEIVDEPVRLEDHIDVTRTSGAVIPEDRSDDWRVREVTRPQRAAADGERHAVESGQLLGDGQLHLGPVESSCPNEVPVQIDVRVRVRRDQLIADPKALFQLSDRSRLVPLPGHHVLHFKPRRGKMVRRLGAAVIG